MTQVLDASALLAFLHREPGEAIVALALDGALVSTVNLAEVLQKSLWRKTDIDGMQSELMQVGVQFEPFTPQHAEISARLWERGKALGLSLADRACLALAIEQEAIVLTADRAWNEPDLGIDIQIVR